MTEAPRTHGLLSGSIAYRWVPCPGSVFLTKDLPPEPPSKHADAGTEAHLAAEIMVEDWLQHKLTGTEPDSRAHILTQNEAALELATKAKELLWENVLKQHITGKVYGQEERLVINEKFGMYGHADFWVIEIDDKGKRCATICDFKFGYLYVPAKNNAQLAFYAYGLREMIREAGKDLDYVRAAIIQPKIEHEPYRETTFTGKQLDAWGKKFEAAAHQIFVKQKPKFKTGNWCTYCKAQSLCKLYNKELNAKTALQLSDGAPEGLPTPDKVPDEMIMNMVLRSDEIASYLKICKAYVINRHREGKPIKGLKIVEGKSRRTWAKDQSDAIHYLANLGCKDYLAPVKLKGITAIEKEVKKLGTNAALDYANYSGKFITKTIPPLTIVSESDSRPAVKDLVSMLSQAEDEDEEIN